MRSVLSKRSIVILHDIVMTGFGLIVMAALRYDPAVVIPIVSGIAPPLPVLMVLGGGIYAAAGLYGARWRFASIPDLINIIRATFVVAAGLFLLDHLDARSISDGRYPIDASAAVVLWLVLVVLLGGPRLAYRVLRSRRAQRRAALHDRLPILILGPAAEAEALIRMAEAGGLGRVRAVGILAIRETDLRQRIRGVPVLGRIEELERIVFDFEVQGIPIRRLVASEGSLRSFGDQLFEVSGRLRLPLLRPAALGSDTLTPVEIEDLILRPEAGPGTVRLERTVSGRRILVTGGGGSIGAELALRCAALGASSIAIIENSEPALHAARERLLRFRAVSLLTFLCDIRERGRVMEIMSGFRPDVVFHAAALKHVPYLEQDWTEALKTNVFGSVNVLDAARESGASVAVQISTDKAVEPVSVLGLTKRVAELYARMLDREGGETRFISVRFGNVIGSQGSVVPKFKAQIASGGPVTVTDHDMVRFFMTIPEAVDLVIAASGHAEDRNPAMSSEQKASIYVLDMGRPIRIYDLAERMIRLAGLEPGKDIAIRITGLRPGERLSEATFSRNEKLIDTGIEKLFAAEDPCFSRKDAETLLDACNGAILSGQRRQLEVAVRRADPNFRSSSSDATALSA
jgi:FlaA1/EpsC-like NDP-sugar epimerase